MKSKEERELRKAIELSKRSILEDKRKREESSSIVSPSSPVTDLSAAASTSSASNINPASRRKEDDTKSQISDISSMDEMILKKPKIPPQRKFAQNSIPPQSMHSSSCTPIKQSSAQSTVHNKSVQLKEVFAAITPSTEDFLTFLCFRNGPALPHKVDLFSMNEKAIQEKRLQIPKNAASVASQTKSPSPLKQDVSKLSNGVTNNKNVDSRRSSATSSSYSSNPFHGAKPPRKSNVKLAIKSESHSVNDKPVKRAKKAVVPDKRVKKSKRTSMPGSESVSKEDAKVDTTPTKRITRSTSSTSYAESTSSIVPPVISVQELKEQQEKRLKEQMIAIEKQHQVRRRLSSDSSLHSSDSSSSESLPSTSSSASINISRVTRSIETLKQLRVIGQQSKLKGGHNSQTRRFARGQVASKAILQKAKRNLNSKSCSNGKLSDKSQQ